MPGGSPTFRTVAAIERLYADLEVLFEDLSAWCAGLTLREFHTRMTTEAAAVPVPADPSQMRLRTSLEETL